MFRKKAENHADSGETAPGRFPILGTFGILFALLVLYILSPLPILLLVGPPVPVPDNPLWMALTIWLSPLDWAYNHNSVVQAFYDWYLSPIKTVP